MSWWEKAKRGSGCPHLSLRLSLDFRPPVPIAAFPALRYPLIRGGTHLWGLPEKCKGHIGRRNNQNGFARNNFFTWEVPYEKATVG